VGDELKNETLYRMSTILSQEQLSYLDNVLLISMSKYEVNKKCTDIIVKDNAIPYEIESFLVCKSIKGLSKATLKQYQRTLISFCKGLNCNIKQATSKDIRLYIYNYEKTHNIGKSALDDIRRILNSFYSWMVREDIIAKNPMVKIDAIKNNKHIREPFTQMEVEQMRNACTTLREKCIFELLYSTGMRVSELTQLNRSDINFDTNRIKVVGKGNKERYVFLNAKAVYATKKYIFSRTDNEEALLVSSKKPYNRLGKGSIEKEINDIATKGYIQRNVFPHLFRHTFATTLYANGVDIASIQSAMGHSNSSTTMIYTKTDVNNLQLLHRRCLM